MSISTARLVKTEKKYAKFINSICEIRDIRYTHDLFIRIGGESLDFGSIDHKEMHIRDGKEYWEIFTSKGYFKIQVLHKPEQKRIPMKRINKEIVDELESKRFIRDFDKMLDDFLNQEIDLNSVVWPWNKD